MQKGNRNFIVFFYLGLVMLAWGSIFLTSCGGDDEMMNPITSSGDALACFSMDRSTCFVGDCTITFDAACSQNAAYYEWDFGDGSPVVGGSDLEVVTHTFSSEGTKVVKLLVNSSPNVSGGGSSSDQKMTEVVVQEIIPPFSIGFENLSPVAFQRVSDGGYIILARAPQDYSFTVFRLSNKGDIQWEKEYQYPYRIYVEEISETNEGRFWISGTSDNEEYRSYFLLIDENGIAVLSKEFDNPVGFVDGGVVTHIPDMNGIIVLRELSTLNEKTYFLLKLNDLGNIEWQSELQIPGDFQSLRLYRLSKSEDGGFFLLGVTGYGSGQSSTTRLFCAKVDFEGNISWQVELADKPRMDAASMVSTSGGVLIGGRYMDETQEWGPYTCEIDFNGNLAWENYLSQGVDNDIGTAITETEDGCALLSSERLISLDQFGNVIWSKSLYDKGIRGRGGRILQKPTNEFVFLSDNVVPGWSGTYEFSLIQTDQDGNF